LVLGCWFLVALRRGTGSRDELPARRANRPTRDLGIGIIGRTAKADQLRFEKAEFSIAVAEAGGIDVVMTQQLKVKIAKGGGLLEHGVPLVTKAAAGDDGGQIVAGVIGRVPEIASDHNGCVVEQATVALRNLIQIEEELVEMLEEVDLDTTEVGDHVRLPSVMRESVPTAGGAGYLDGPIDPVHGEGDDPGGVGLEGKLGQFEQVLDLGIDRKLLFQGFIPGRRSGRV